MTSLFMKIIMCPLLVGLASFLLPNVNYTNVWQPIIIGLVLAIVGTMMEYMALGENTVFLSTALDFIAATLIVYFGTLLFENAGITFFGAILTALILGVAEHFTHRYLVDKEKAERGAFS